MSCHVLLCILSCYFVLYVLCLDVYCIVSCRVVFCCVLCRVLWYAVVLCCAVLHCYNTDRVSTMINTADTKRASNN